MIDTASFFADHPKIFLHFVNRELHESLSRTVDTKIVRDVLRVAVVTHCQPLFCNVSQLFEALSDDQDLVREVLRLSEEAILLIQSPYPSTLEFRASRVDKYAHDRSRYPMYFLPHASSLDGAPISALIDYGPTKFLDSELSSWHPDTFSSRTAQLLREFERKSLQPISKQIRRATIDRENRAITFAHYKLQMSRHRFVPREEGALRRAISSLYVDHYVTEYKAVILSGIPHLSYYDRNRFYKFPLYDYPVLKSVLQGLRYFDHFERLGSTWFEQCITLHRSALHLQFCSILHPLLTSLGSFFADDRSESDCRDSIINVLRTKLARTYQRRLIATYQQFLDSSCDHIRRAISDLTSENDRFRTYYESATVENVKAMRLLICTANDLEDRVLFKELATTSDQEHRRHFEGNVTYSEFPSRGGIRIFHVRSSAGSSEPSGSSLVTAEAALHLKPNYIVSVGICFGFRENKHRLGDVIVSDYVRCYELARITQSNAGEAITVTPRGSRFPASPKLLDRFRTISRDWHEAPVHFGTVMSGDKLVDAPDFRVQLLRIEPEAIAGEMEASGIIAAAYRALIPFIVVKGICDWGMKKDKAVQKQAAKNAVRLVVRLIESGGLSG